MFLDDHMSSSRRNIKHLKVTFAKCAAAAAAGAEELGKKRQKQVTLADTQTLGLQRQTSKMTSSLDHFALQRCLERGYKQGKKVTTASVLTLDACGKTAESSHSFTPVCGAGTAVLEMAAVARGKILPRIIK